MNQDYSMKYGDFLRECGHFDPEFMLSAHLSTVSSFCISLPNIIDQLTPSDMADLRGILMNWLEDDEARWGELLKGGKSHDAQCESHREVFVKACHLLEKAYTSRPNNAILPQAQAMKPDTLPCAVCKWRHAPGQFTTFSGGNKIITLTEKVVAHKALKLVHDYMENNAGAPMPRKVWDENGIHDEPANVFRRQEAWGMICCPIKHVQILPPDRYNIRKRPQKTV